MFLILTLISAGGGDDGGGTVTAVRASDSTFESVKLLDILKETLHNLCQQILMKTLWHLGPFVVF